MQSLFITLPFVVCTLCFITFALYWRKANPAQHILTFFFFIASTLYWGHAVYFSHTMSIFPVSDSIYAFATTAVYPIFYLYLRRLTHPGTMSWRWWLILLPALTIGVWAALLYTIAPTNPAIHHGRYLAMKIIGIAQIIAVCTLGLHHLRSFDRQVANYYADTDQRNVRKLRLLLLFFVLTSIGSAILTHLGRESFNQSLFIIPAIVFSTLLFSIAHVGYNQNFDADRLQAEFENADRNAFQEAEAESPEALIAVSASNKQTLPDTSPTPENDGNENSDELLLHLKRLMEHEQLFLRPNLLLSDITRRLCTNRTRLSALINRHFGMAFSDYINQLRIRHAITLLNDENNTLSIREIGEHCGFGTEASFHRNFKKITGQTPAGLRKRTKSRE
ncbi:AraC family transcriptional regulator [Alloprevotella sp. OH1205_COT-284]|uniref:helix-turn-helix domain-containing protein n=1 Tax=Alloprevotella sp. OH1205_COT-284 TaxID=2491043 RepID=UPI000F5EBBFA|nr:helix-turn-helix domain-containing protein [Alloprevotella sp. OH1205_COT-284]RRD80321.1 AraC family transcriptional regulator [Alloprevotella sp. OH1205_COT-284]